MINNIKNRRALWIGLIGVSILLLALGVGQYARGGPLPLATGAPLWVTDIRDDRKLSGLADNIWFGQVMGKTGQVEDSAPATHYSVVVFESLKGELSGMITVSQEGADMSNGQQFRLQGAPDLPEPGKSYLFITRADPLRGTTWWCPVLETCSLTWTTTLVEWLSWGALTLIVSANDSRARSRTKSRCPSTNGFSAQP